MTNKISEFFYHILNYGGFSFKEGKILMWGDPDIMILPECFLDFQLNIEKKLKDDSKNLFYWLGYVYGKNASTVLVKKFGFNINDFDKFTNGATQDGFGYVEITKYPEAGKPLNSTLKGTNCILAQISNERGLNRISDEYLAGMIVGGSEPLFNKDLIGYEEKCIGKGDEFCLFHVLDNQPKMEYPFLSKVGLNHEELNKKILRNYMNENMDTSFMEKKEVHFGDGTFRLKNVQGVLMPVTSFEILNKICIALIPDYREMIYDSVKNTSKIIKQTKIELSKKEIDYVLKEIEIFGLGKFTALGIKDKEILIENSNSPCPTEHKSIFGISKDPTCFLAEAILKTVLEKVLEKKISVTEISCISQGKPKCIFEIKME